VVCVWAKMEGKQGTRNGASCSIGPGSMRHTALTICDPLIETIVTDSESY